MPHDETAVCPTCGTALPTRFGAILTPMKARMLDYIADLNDTGGADIEAMAWVFYPGESKKKASARIRNHIGQINDRLAATDFKVINGKGVRIINAQKLIPSDDKRWKGTTGIVYRLVRTDAHAA